MCLCVCQVVSGKVGQAPMYAHLTHPSPAAATSTLHAIIAITTQLLSVGGQRYGKMKAVLLACYKDFRAQYYTIYNRRHLLTSYMFVLARERYCCHVVREVARHWSKTDIPWAADTLALIPTLPECIVGLHIAPLNGVYIWMLNIKLLRSILWRLLMWPQLRNVNSWSLWQFFYARM